MSDNISTRDEWRQCGTHSVSGLPYEGPWRKGVPGHNDYRDARQSLKNALQRCQNENPKVWIETRTVTETITAENREEMTL